MLIIFSAKKNNEYYFNLISHWNNPADIVKGSFEPKSIINTDLKDYDNVHQMMYFDSMFYLPDDIMVKVDRATMGVSLESRAPFLDHRLIEFVWQLPLQMKVRGGKGKWLLRQLLYKYVPKELVERPKMGFGIPIDRWVRGELKDWAESLIDEQRLINEGFFNPSQIRNKWKEHLEGNRNWSHHLWDVLMFQSWLEKWKT